MCKSQSQSESETTEEYDFENTITIRSKWALDGCKTMDEIIARLYEQIEYFKQLKEDGFEIINEISDDYGDAKKLN